MVKTTDLAFLSALALAKHASADIVLENELIKTEEIFDLVYARESEPPVFAGSSVQAMYYCVFRSNWNKKNHPEDYPSLANWGAPAILSHTKQYAPFLKGREAEFGVEQIAETGSVEVFAQEVRNAGELIGDFVEGEMMMVDQKDWKSNYQYLDPIEVSLEHKYLTGVASIQPSPDWYSPFYMWDVIKENGNMYWDSFKLRTYPWDAGTDNGKLYTEPDEDTVPPERMRRFTVNDAPNGIFVSPLGDEILYVAEWECVLHTCPLDQPDCPKENWPPANGCDVLRYPLCDKPCDPNNGAFCNKCENGEHFQDCCMAGTRPASGELCPGEEQSSAFPQMSGFTMLILSAIAALLL